MGSDDEIVIDKEKLLIVFLVVAIIIVIIILLIPSKNSQPGTPSRPTVTETIKLVGDNPYYLAKGKPYEEPGYEAYDSLGNNVSYKIEKSGSVDYNTPGEYEIVYKINSVEVRRKVIVSSLEASIIEDSNEYTNESYNIMLLIKGSDYSKTLLPNGSTSLDRAIEYEVNENGVYTFIIYGQHNNELKVEKKVTNFDKEPPKGTCTNKLELGKTYVEVEATDTLSGIASYIYSNGNNSLSSKENKYTYSGLYKDINVTLVDKVGNKDTIKCVSSGEGATAQIKPPSGANIIKSAESDTLKVSIEKKSSYYITRVWVLDPYSQINKGLNNWGKNLLKPYNIISNDISKYGLQNKIVVGINGSGFYSLGSWEPSCSSSCKNDYNKTTEGALVIADGKVLRNWYTDAYVDKSRNHATYAISKDGNLDVYYNYNKMSESDRKALYNSIISKGYRNTWTFRPVIMMNGRLASSDILGTFLNSSAKRNVLCQIDRNNFAIFTSNGSHNVNDLNSVLTSLKCQTAINLDGGGSTALLFKSKNGSLETINGGGRSIVDTLYFFEK